MAIWERLLGHDTLDEHQSRSLGFFGTMALWLGANVVVTTILTGMLLVPDLHFTTAIAIVLIGSLIGAVPLLLVGLMGQHTGLPSMVLTRRAYGPSGSRLISLVNMCVLIAWSWIQALLAGMSLNYAVSSATGFDNLALMTIICEVIVVLIVLRGHLGIERIERWVASVMVVLAQSWFIRSIAIMILRPCYICRPSRIAASLSASLSISSWPPPFPGYPHRPTTTVTARPARSRWVAPTSAMFWPV